MAYILYDNSFIGNVKPVLKKSSSPIISDNQDHIVVNLYSLGKNFTDGFKKLIGWNITTQEIVKDLKFYKTYAVGKIRDYAFDILRLTDYQVLRHKEQIERGVTTTLTTAEYNTLLDRREQGRIWISARATQIRNATTANEIKNVIKTVEDKVAQEKQNLGEII